MAEAREQDTGMDMIPGYERPTRSAVVDTAGQNVTSFQIVIGSRRELVANSIHTADADATPTQLNSTVEFFMSCIFMPAFSRPAFSCPAFSRNPNRGHRSAFLTDTRPATVHLAD